MMDSFQIKVEPERVFLVGMGVRGSRPLLSVEDSLRELALLAETAGLVIVGQTTQHLRQIDPATFIGAGKVEEVREVLEDLEAQVVVFDEELSPRHQRELERRFGDGVKVVDRSALILDIFAQHARTREGALQVELAQYEYRLPRLTHQWTHLARQSGGTGARGGVGGVGLRGPGETQLEADRREIGRKIRKLKQELEQVRAHRSRQRQQRAQAGIPVIALVGYTNAGKSSLLQALSGAEVVIADQLFATLDPTTRRVRLPSGRHVVITDTVGFIQKLPTTLIAAFRATLEGILEADVLLHVVDASHSNVLQHIETVEDTLAQIDVPSVPRLLVWNKADLLQGDVPDLLPEREPYIRVVVSARHGTGIEHLLDTIEEVLTSVLYRVKLLVPYQRGELVAALYESAKVESEEHTAEGSVVTVQLPASLYARYKDYRISE